MNESDWCFFIKVLTAYLLFPALIAIFVCVRWFDKSFTLIVTKTGRASVNFEHSWGDGVAMLRYMIETFKDTTTNPRISPGTQPVVKNSSVRKLGELVHET